MLTNTADIELFLDRHYEDIYWVAEKFLAVNEPITPKADKKGEHFKTLNSFSWSQFEWFCAQLLRKDGWILTDFDDNVSCGQASNNSRADIIAIRKHPITGQNERIFVSCKRYANPIPISFVQDVINVKNRQQHEFFDEVKNIAYLMTTNIFDQNATTLADQNQVQCLDFYKIKKLNLQLLISQNKAHKWQPEFGKFAKIQKEHEELGNTNRELNQNNETLRQQIEIEKTEKESLENEKNNLNSKIENLNIEIKKNHQNYQNQTQKNDQNWQKDQQEFIKQNKILQSQKEQAEIRIAQIGLALDEKTTKINQQEKELNREKNQNQANTRINFQLLKKANTLNLENKQNWHKTNQIIHQKDIEKSKLKKKYQQNSHFLTQNLQEESLGKVILSTSLIIVFGLFLTMSFWIILN